MELYIPYLALAGVCVLFFIVCTLVFRESVPKAETVAPQRESLRGKSSFNYGASYYNHAEGKSMERGRQGAGGTEASTDSPAVAHGDRSAMAKMAAPDKMRQASPLDIHAAPIERSAKFPVSGSETSVVMLEETQAIPKVAMDSDKPEATQVIRIDTPQLLESEHEADVTRVFTPVRAAETAAVNEVVADERGNDISIATAENDELNVVSQAACAYFMNSYGLLSEQAKTAVREITEEALHRLDIHHTDELQALLENIVVQEALFCMQKAYVSTTTSWMRETALEAFLDVVRQPKSSTPYIVAFDALRILPHLTLGHFQTMAIALLLQYSRNSNNYSLENFRHYVTKYLEPFLSDLPHDDSMYKQMDYLRCSVQDGEPTAFTGVLSASYPLVFAYRGFTLDELTRALGGERLPAGCIVDSLNSSMKKLALVDEALAPRFFRMVNISDEEVQRSILTLLKSKPTSFTGAESIEILEHISPILVELGKVYNQTPLCRMSLTLLGLYLGRAHVKATIGEEFDLSRWF